jgi:hypothetical protein
MSDQQRSFCMPHWAIVRDNMPRGANGVMASILVMQAIVEDPRWPGLIDQAADLHPGESRYVSDDKGQQYVSAKLSNAALAMLNGPGCCWLPPERLRQILREAHVPEDALP